MIKPRVVDLSIIIISTNEGYFLKSCLQSIYDSKPNVSFETVVVNNCSDDNTVDILETDFPAVNVISNERKLGFSANNNQAIKRSGGRYILILNSDIVVLLGSLESMVGFMEEHPEAGIAGCKLLNPDYSLQYSCRKFSTLATFFLRGLHFDTLFPNSTMLRKYMMSDWDHNQVREVDWVMGSCMMVRRKAIEEVGMLDENFILYFEDQDWCYRMWKHGWKVHYVPQAQMIHYYPRRSAKGIFNALTWIHIRSMFYFFKKHYLQFPLCADREVGGFLAGEKEKSL